MEVSRTNAIELIDKHDSLNLLSRSGNTRAATRLSASWRAQHDRSTRLLPSTFNKPYKQVVGKLTPPYKSTSQYASAVSDCQGMMLPRAVAPTKTDVERFPAVIQ